MMESNRNSQRRLSNYKNAQLAENDSDKMVSILVVDQSIPFHSLSLPHNSAPTSLQYYNYNLSSLLSSHSIPFHFHFSHLLTRKIRERPQKSPPPQLYPFAAMIQCARADTTNTSDPAQQKKQISHTTKYKG